MILDYANPEKSNWFLVSWTMSNKCNYKCSYCPSILHNGTTGHPNWSVVKNFIENLNIPGKEICFRMSGGEPTYWKHFIDTAKLIKSKGHTFSFLTNGSKSADYYKEIGQYTDGVIISYHPEYADLKHIEQVVKAFDCPVAFNLMLKPLDFDSMVHVASQLYAMADNVTVWPKVILDKTSMEYALNEVEEYTIEQQEIISNWKYSRKLDDLKVHRGGLLLDGNSVTANDLILSGQNNFKGWKCWAGLHMINIDMWGNVYRADCQQGGPIGNLNDYTLPSTPIICNTSKCACLSDIYLRKES